MLTSKRAAGNRAIRSRNRPDIGPVKRICIAQATRIIEAIPESDAETIAGGRLDELLYRLVVAPEALNALEANNPLARARLRGREIADELLAREGGCINALQAAKHLRMTPQGVDKRRKKGLLIALDLGRKGFAYPLWQFSTTGGVLKGLESILAILRGQGCSDWSILSFFLNAHIDLDEQSPLQSLRRGKIAAVAAAASIEGEMGK